MKASRSRVSAVKENVPLVIRENGLRASKGGRLRVCESEIEEKCGGCVDRRGKIRETNNKNKEEEEEEGEQIQQQ